jgi:hypothetical protein
MSKDNSDSISSLTKAIILALLAILAPIILSYVRRATVYNGLMLPVRVYVNGVDQGILHPGTSDKFFLSEIPSRITYELERGLSSSGDPWGVMISGEFYRVGIFQYLEITNITREQYYFYPQITNKSALTCEIIINAGLPNETRVGSIGSYSSNVTMGYYDLYSTSNVVFDCEGQIIQWGTNEYPLYNFVQQKSGGLEIVFNADTTNEGIPTPDFTEAVGQVDDCRSLPSRLSLGITAYISYEPPEPNTVRESSGKFSTPLGKVYPGDRVKIVDGPICENGWHWWKIESLESGLSGWTPEGDSNYYWLNPE